MEFNYIIKLTNVMKAINPNTELNSIVLLLLYLSVTSFLLRTQSGNPLFNEPLTKQRYIQLSIYARCLWLINLEGHILLYGLLGPSIVVG